MGTVPLLLRRHSGISTTLGFLRMFLPQIHPNVLVENGKEREGNEIHPMDRFLQLDGSF